MVTTNLDPVPNSAAVQPQPTPPSRSSPEATFLTSGRGPETSASAETRTSQPDVGLGNEQSHGKETSGLNEAVERLQAAVDTVSRQIRFELDEGEVHVRVVDRETQEVIREIPPEEAIRIAERLGELIGLIFDKEV